MKFQYFPKGMNHILPLAEHASGCCYLCLRATQGDKGSCGLILGPFPEGEPLLCLYNYPSQ